MTQSGGLMAAASARNRAFIGKNEHDYVLVHAGVAQLGDATLLFPGSPESGKSTLVAGLVRSGWTYLSDELALLDPQTGVVMPYQRPISIDTGAYDLFPELRHRGYAPSAEQWHVDAEDLRCGATGGVLSAIPTHVVFNRYDPTSSTTLAPLRQATALLQLIGNSVRLANHGAIGFEVLAVVAEKTESFSLDSNSLAEQVSELSSLVQ